MSMSVSPGVYPREIDNSFRVPAIANSIGGIVIHSDKGVTGKLNLVTSNKEFLDTYGNPTPDNPSMYVALAFLEKGKRLYVARAINDALKSSVTVDDTQATPVLAFTVYAANEGAWGNNLTISTTATTNDIFTLTVKENGTIVETFEVSRNPLLKNGFGESVYIEDVVNKLSTYITVTDNVSNTYTNADVAVVTDVALTGGANDTTAPTDGQINTEWDRFAVKEDVEVSLLINGGWATASVHQKMIGICESRKDCFAILDFSSSDKTVSAMQTYVNTTLNANTSYAAIYGGWLYIYDQYNDKYLYIPPSGYIAGAFAYTAQVSEVWYAPAGVRRGLLNVQGVETVWSEGDRDSLYSSRINPIQNFVGEGIQVYGQKTLQSSASALDRVNVRMLMITIQKALEKALRPFVFEFNDEFTRNNITSIVESYLEDIKIRRGLYDYLVVADESNNTPTVIDQNKLILDVYIKPIKVAEFIQLNVVIAPTGAKFTVN